MNVLRTRRITAALQHQGAPAAISPPEPRRRGWGMVPGLLLLGMLIGGIWFVLLPLLGGSGLTSDPVQRALPDLFPWLQQLYWTIYLPEVLSWLAHVPLFNPLGAGPDNANVQILLLGLAFLLVLLAARVGNGMTQGRAGRGVSGVVLFLILVFAALFGLVLVFAPVRLEAFSEDILNYALYGRMVVVYHVNPYAVSPTQFAKDMFYVGATHLPIRAGSAPYGPVWLDISLLLALFAHDSIANVLLGFRLLGLATHLTNATLIWYIVTRIRPEMRATTTLLYAWNPLVLLLSVFVMHEEAVMALFLLLGVIFLLRNSPLMSWVFALLAVLVNPLCLVVLPLFFVMSFRQSRVLRLGRLILWWLTFWLVTALMLVLAYTPYLQDLGTTGLQAGLVEVFWQQSALNSLDAALLNLPVQFPSELAWLLAPAHWTLGVLAIVGIFLLFSLWFANTVELLALCASWLFLLLVMLQPIYWPWYVLMGLALALCSAHWNTLRLAVLLSLGALLCYYCWLWQPVWSGQALLTIGLPFILWGWVLFFTTTWSNVRSNGTPQPAGRTRSAPRTWFSRPSRPGRE